MLTQDWGVIVEALSGSPVVEIGAGGALLRARDGWANWVLPPEQRDKTAHAPFMAPPIPAAPSAAQTPLQSPQRPYAASAQFAAAHASENGPFDSSTPMMAMQADLHGANDAGLPAAVLPPSVDAQHSPEPTAESDGVTVQQTSADAAPAGDEAPAVADVSLTPSDDVVVNVPHTKASQSSSQAADDVGASGRQQELPSAQPEPAATPPAVAQLCGHNGTRTASKLPKRSQRLCSLRQRQRGAQDIAEEPETTNSAVADAQRRSVEDSTAHKEAAHLHQEGVRRRLAPQRRPLVELPAQAIALCISAVSRRRDSCVAPDAGDDGCIGFSSGRPAASPKETATKASGSAKLTQQMAPVAAPASRHRSSEDLEDDMFQLDEVPAYALRSMSPSNLALSPGWRCSVHMTCSASAACRLAVCKSRVALFAHATTAREHAHSVRRWAIVVMTGAYQCSSC